MLRYVTTAGALKVFSLNALSRNTYRYLGNTVGAKRRSRAGLPSVYLERAKDIVARVRAHDIIKPGQRVLELGTGWLHWEATVLRLFYDVQASLFDVWDNRQFVVFQRYFAELASVIDGEIPMDEGEKTRVHDVLDRLGRATSFDDAYAILGHRYVVDPKGTLDTLPDNSFGFVFSCSVLEHVGKDLIPSFVDGCYRVLEPGGYCYHLIDLSDHLAHYDKQVCPKNYLRYSDTMWWMLFENDVQYFNRVQRPQWLAQFERAGFTLIEERRNTVDLNGVKLARVYAGLDQEDATCVQMGVLYRKPGGGA